MAGGGPRVGTPADPRLLRERLRVVAAPPGRLRLSAPRAAGCAACGARAACGGAAASGPARLLEIACPPDLAPRPGDEVEVALSGGRFLAAVGLAYLLPTLAVVTAAGAGLALHLPDLGVALLCLPALALSLIPLALAGRGEGLAEALCVEALHPAGPSGPDPCGP